MSTLISYQKAYFTKGTERRFPVTFVTVGSRNQAFLFYFVFLSEGLAVHYTKFQ